MIPTSPTRRIAIAATTVAAAHPGPGATNPLTADPTRHPPMGAEPSDARRPRNQIPRLPPCRR